MSNWRTLWSDAGLILVKFLWKNYSSKNSKLFLRNWIQRTWLDVFFHLRL